MLLTLKNNLSKEEELKFSVPNIIELKDYYGPKYYMNLCAIYKDKDGYKYHRDYMIHYIYEDVKPEEVIEFYNNHKDVIIKEKVFEDNKFLDIYYADYTVLQEPSIYTNFFKSLKNSICVELTFCFDGYSRVENVFLYLSENISVFNAIHSLFSNENISEFKFVEYKEGTYNIKMYNRYGRERTFHFKCMEEILDIVINMRLTNCRNKIGE